MGGGATGVGGVVAAEVLLYWQQVGVGSNIYCGKLQYGNDIFSNVCSCS